MKWHSPHIELENLYHSLEPNKELGILEPHTHQTHHCWWHPSWQLQHLHSSTAYKVNNSAEAVKMAENFLVYRNNLHFCVPSLEIYLILQVMLHKQTTKQKLLMKFWRSEGENASSKYNLNCIWSWLKCIILSKYTVWDRPFQYFRRAIMKVPSNTAWKTIQHQEHECGSTGKNGEGSISGLISR